MKNKNLPRQGRKKYKYNKKLVLSEMKKMRESVDTLTSQIKNLELDKLKENDVNPVFLRNVRYVGNITNHVANNFDYMLTLDPKKNLDHRIIIRKKFLASGVMIRHINDLVERYSYDSADFEVHNLLMNQDNMPKIFKNLSKDNIEYIKEEFQEAEKNKKIIEGFAIAPLISFFIKIGMFFKKIIFGIVKIGKFVGSFLFKFIKFVWKMLTFLFKLVTVIIPRMIRNIFSFFMNLLRKTIKVGLFTMLLFVFLLMVFMKYWQIVLELGQPPIPVIFFPALLITIHLFWNETNTLFNAQMSIINGILWFFFGPMKNLLILILGLPKNDAFFRKKNANIFTKIKFFIIMLAKNMAFILFRFFVSLLAIKYLIMYAFPIIVNWLPTPKELLIFPMILFNYIVSFVKKLFNFVVT